MHLFVQVHACICTSEGWISSQHGIEKPYLTMKLQIIIHFLETGPKKYSLFLSEQTNSLHLTHISYDKKLSTQSTKSISLIFGKHNGSEKCINPILSRSLQLAKLNIVNTFL